MQEPMSDSKFHVINFEHPLEAAAFVAALSRFLNSPQGVPFRAHPELLEVLSRATEEASEVYLSSHALRAAVAAFAPVPVADTCLRQGLPKNCVRAFTGLQTPAWGVLEARAKMTQAH